MNVANTENSKVVLISGGSKGLGLALVESLLAAGNRVATFSRSASAEIEQLMAADPDATKFYWQAVDGTDAENVKKFAMSVIKKYKKVDVLINNAGTGVDGLLTMMTEKDIHFGINLNLESTILLTRTCLKSMLQSKQGCVINISSVNGLRGHKGLSVYSATKSALHGFTQSLAREVGSAGIRVNCIAPGYFDSDLASHLTEQQRATIIRRTPLKKLCTVDDLVEAAQFLINSKAVTGQVLAVDGGFSC